MGKVILMILLAVGSSSAVAQSCSSLSQNIDDARTELTRARDSNDFDNAKNYARRAKNELEDAELAANDCKCPLAASEFDDAARHAKRARDSDSGSDFANELRRAIRDFNSALSNIRLCKSSRR